MTDTDAARIIAALVGDASAGLVYVTAGYGEVAYWTYECAYCEQQDLEFATFTHAPDCPILAGRAWLARQALIEAGYHVEFFHERTDWHEDGWVLYRGDMHVSGQAYTDEQSAWDEAAQQAEAGDGG
jgi:hypothetical protein